MMLALVLRELNPLIAHIKINNCSLQYSYTNNTSIMTLLQIHLYSGYMCYYGYITASLAT